MLHYLLTGYFPFGGELTPLGELKKEILAGDFDVDWFAEDLEEPAKQLLSGLLAPADERLSLAEVKQSLWWGDTAEEVREFWTNLRRGQNDPPPLY